MRELSMLQERQRTAKKALENFNKNSPLTITSAEPKKRLTNQTDEVRALIIQKVDTQGSMTWIEASKAYGVSHATIGKILKAHRNPVKKERKI